MKTKIMIDGVVFTKFTTLPLQEQTTADDSLDAGYFELIGTKIDKPFLPFTKCQIVKNDGIEEVVEYYYIASDECTEIIQNKTFNHDLVLIEESKEMERYSVNTKTITNPIVHDYLSNKHTVLVAGTTTEFWFFPDSKYIELDILSPQEVNKTIKIPRPYNILMEYFTKTNYAFKGTVSTDYNSVTLDIIAPDGTTVASEKDSCSGSPDEYYFDFTPSQLGDYTFKLDADGNLGDIGHVTASFNIVIVTPSNKKDDWTIKQVCDVLLQTCDCLREGESPRFVMAQPGEYEKHQDVIADLFASKSPEFSFTRCTLFEALKEVGDYIHAIPRLRNNKVFFDLLGLDEKCSVNLEKYNSHVETRNIDNFCSELDMNVDNLMESDNDAEGSVIEPYNNGYKTIRVETGTAQITEDGMIIATEHPIYDVIKLEAGYLSNGAFVGDITPFVYENAEYLTLSSSSDKFPTSKMFAIKFTQGQKNITELNFKNEHLISQAFENYAILNILYKKLNLSTNWWSNFWNNEDVYNLQFKITYIPMVSARVKQVKPNVEDMAFKNVLSYNQSANMVSANALGEHLKGVVAKYGVPEKKLIFTVSKLSEVPKVNTIYGDYTITSVKTETYNNFILVEVGMSKDFNNKCAYLSINSQRRYYEVSEKASYQRFVIYEEYCLIGDDYGSDEGTLMTDFSMNGFVNSFTTGELTNVGLVKLKGYMEDNTELPEIVRPVVTLGIGNSMLFAFYFEDNYSAGQSASYNGSTKIQEYVKYVDVHGEVDKMELTFGRIKDFDYSYSLAVETGDLFPHGASVPDGHMETIFTTNNKPIILKKDNREQIAISYQMHFLATKDRKNMIIGSGMGRKNTFTSKENLNYKLFILPKKINKFESSIDLTGATELEIKVTKHNNHKLKLENVTATAEGSAWALVNAGSTNELLVGENISIKNGEEISLPFFNFTRKIRD